jgi:hypothetical protein
MIEMPHPPFPDPDSAVLGPVVRNAIDALRSGEVTAEQAVLPAAVHAWYEGHIEGEDVCPGCDYRGQVHKRTAKGWIDPQRN